jgi:hypothetical protein
METRPPALVESVVRLFVPPVAREHVLGDLSERYSSAARYVIDAIRTIPFVIASQIRRTSYFPIWPLVGAMLMAGFSAGTSSWGLHSLIPSLATLFGFMIRDAYRVPDLRHPWRQGFIDLLIVAATVIASEVVVAFLRPEWLIGRTGISGGAIVLIVLYVLRGKNPHRRLSTPPSASDTAMTLDQLRNEVASYDQLVQRALKIEIAIGCVLIPLFAIFAAVADPVLVRVGAALTVAGILFVVCYISLAYRRSRRANALSTDGDFTTTLDRYRARLEGQVHALRTVWWWYLLPLGIGPALIISGGVAAAGQPPSRMVGAIGGFMLAWIWAAWIAGRQARAFQRRLAAVSHITERH